MDWISFILGFMAGQVAYVIVIEVFRFTKMPDEKP